MEGLSFEVVTQLMREVAELGFKSYLEPNPTFLYMTAYHFCLQWWPIFTATKLIRWVPLIKAQDRGALMYNAVSGEIICPKLLAQAHRPLPETPGPSVSQNSSVWISGRWRGSDTVHYTSTQAGLGAHTVISAAKGRRTHTKHDKLKPPSNQF